MPVARSLLLLTLCLALAGCGFRDSRLNPFNWFGRGEPREAVVATDPTDPRPLVAGVVSLTVEPTQGGAIVRARGQTPTQGWWDAELVEVPTDNPGVLVYEFRLKEPTERTDVSTPQSREVDVAVFVSRFDLDGVGEIVVQGAQNALTSRR